MQLSARVSLSGPVEPFITRLSEDASIASADPARESLLLRNNPGAPIHLDGVRAVFLGADVDSSRVPSTSVVGPLRIQLPESLGYLRTGDVVRVSSHPPEVRVLYRRESAYNAILLTERCNSLCLMCSQPPRPEDDGYLVQEAIETIRLMSPETKYLGITGGEPTLLLDGFLFVIAAARDSLPEARLQVLSNGRMFSYLRYAREVAAVGHPNVLFGVPLYSAMPWQHDYVVQAKGAFDQTVRGLQNLARCRVPIELRIVLHADTFQSLPEFARFVARNLPFVHHVALMGLEMMGYARTNLNALWIDPVDYKAELCEAVEILSQARIPVSIFNHPLCVLDKSVWAFARKSISDWKRIYLPCCEACEAREACGGLFASSNHRRSSHIAPIALGAHDVPAS